MLQLASHKALDFGDDVEVDGLSLADSTHTEGAFGKV
jgi:hypothetical protein